MITLATLPQATAQQVFDQVATHLLTQKKKSRVIHRDNGKLGFPKGDSCVYRTPEGLKCAAGCLISDEEYLTLIGESRNSIPWNSLIARGVAPEEHRELIVSLQRCHDHNTPEYWDRYLLDIAKAYDLSPAVLDQFKP